MHTTSPAAWQMRCFICCASFPSCSVAFGKSIEREEGVTPQKPKPGMSSNTRTHARTIPCGSCFIRDHIR
uniref:Putative secreted protein n=1 Tax=Anopheles darlingi TaxID=43151 RepID=A0A2M4DHJ4_ANODA